MVVYATYFDSRFLVFGAACLRSIVRHATGPVHLRVLALDDLCAELLPGVLGPIPAGVTMQVDTLDGFEARHPALAAVRANRSRTEYIFTLTPFVCLDAVNCPQADGWCVYLDADTFFFADPAIAFRNVGAADVAVTEHRFPSATRHLAATYGRFNVGWLAFRPTAAGRACLADWGRDCLASCSLDEASGRFGDQKYLDAWPARFPTLAIVDDPGLNAGPWNAAGHVFARRGDTVLVDGRPLLLFHFHRLTRYAAGLYETDYRDYGALPAALREQVYPAYIQALEAIVAEHEAVLPKEALRNIRKPPPAGLPRRIARRLLAAWRLFSRRRVVFSDGRALGPIQGMLHV